MTEKTQLQVEAIKNGSVIDHIPAGNAINILKLFHLLDNNDRVTVGFNLPSKALGHKDIIKVENVRLTEAQTNQLALFAQPATVNIIKDFKVVEKRTIAIPERITEVFSCPNSNCITHVEQAAVSDFKILKKNGKIQLKCKYCERVFNKEVIIENV
jgi:aspartate carbamoyltransferase regulatory subunit